MVDQKTAKKVLIVEDEAPLRNVLRDKLASDGLNVLTAENGEQGLKIALSEHPALILLDILLPGVTGLKMLESLRADAWGKTGVTVFIITNVDKSKEITEAMNYNIAKYIIKSDIKLDDLSWSVKTYLEGDS